MSERIRDLFVVTVDAQITSADNSCLMSQTNALCNDFNHSKCLGIVIDCNHVHYFSSIVLESLLRLWTAMGQKPGLLAACCLSKFGRETLEVARLDRLWAVCDDRDEAIEAVDRALKSQRKI